MQQQKLTVAFRVYALRKHSMRLSASLHTASRRIRSFRKWRTRPGANQAAILECEREWSEIVSNIGGALVASGQELVRLGDEIDAVMNVSQKAALISAGRCGEPMPEGTRFLEMIGAGFEAPKDRRGRAQCGPLFLLFSAALGAMLCGKHEREQQELVAARVKAAGPLNMPPPSAVQ
jgi:hypothetical protein